LISDISDCSPKKQKTKPQKVVLEFHCTGSVRILITFVQYFYSILVCICFINDYSCITFFSQCVFCGLLYDHIYISLSTKRSVNYITNVQESSNYGSDQSPINILFIWMYSSF